jgi:hypothetical protein
MMLMLTLWSGGFVPRLRRALGLIAAVLIGATAAGCLGNFDPPNLDSPRDPANPALPAAPAISAVPSGCQGGNPRVRVSWSLDAGPETGGFQVYRSSAEFIDPGLLLASLPANAREFVDGVQQGSGLAGGLPYWYRVRTLSTDGLPGLRSAPDSATAPLCN